MPPTAAALDRSPAREHGAARRRRWRPVVIGLALLAIYPLALLAYVYAITLTSGLPGGRHGPQDAYRHTLASAVLAWSLSPRAVALVTAVMEADDDPGSRMDRHNNAIGASIGAATRSFTALRPQVLARVQAGRVNAGDPEQVTWLPAPLWTDLPF